MPVESSIYWESIDSQRSASGGSSGDVCNSSENSGRHYVDPWDLENYAYLRRHSIAVPLHPQRQRRSSRSSRLSHDRQTEPEYWCPPSSREPGYVAPAFVEELYGGAPPRQANNGFYYHQPIYEDEIPDYVSPYPVYAPLSDLGHREAIEDHRGMRHRCRSASARDRHREGYFSPELPAHAVRERDISHYRFHQQYPAKIVEREAAMEVVPPPHLDLNTYGHLKIDYTNSWNSLNRKIGK